jgi:hypothetical protein
MYLHPDYHLKLHHLRLKEFENRHRFAPPRRTRFRIRRK